MGDDSAALAAEFLRSAPLVRELARGGAREALLAECVAHIENPRVDFARPLEPIGTAFQRRVWAHLRTIPAGETVSYAAVAAGLEVPGSARAVAGACARNPIAVAIPCHRVVRSDGALGGYRWGLERKRALLAREADCG